MANNHLSEFYGPNAGYVLELYERYQHDPASVDAAARAFFDGWTPPARPGPAAAPVAVAAVDLDVRANKVSGAVQLAAAIRLYGHRCAQLDPLGTQPPGDPALELPTWGLTREDLAQMPASIVGGPLARGAQNALQAIDALREVYTATTGYDFEHVDDPAERNWLREAVEGRTFYPPNEPLNERWILDRLTEVGAFERFMHRTFPGRTRFSLEGLGMMVPMLDEWVACGAEGCNPMVFIGMAHRGRLNVLTHIMGKPYADIFAEFGAPAPRPDTAPSESGGAGYTGDVTYHLGARHNLDNEEQIQVTVHLAPNPSHLEYVDPVVEGMARAAQEYRDEAGVLRHDESLARPILIHGDASFTGQGIVSETLNLSRLAGYQTGGTIHIIINNQLGFTETPETERSTVYASDVAKGFEIPVLHVNADDPVACIAVARLAYAYRERFHSDILVDLIGYRRWGHNEGDEPSFTQPLMYEKIANHPTVRELWAQHLVEQGVVAPDEPDKTLEAALDRLRQVWDKVRSGEITHPIGEEVVVRDTRHGPVDTSVPLDRLAELNRALVTFPEGFTLNPKLDRPMDRRRSAFEADGGGEVDWAHAEALAFASLLADGTPVRLTGQDVARGTFSQRHLALHDAKTGEVYTPLEHLPAARASFAVYDSPLSESAPVGFEYGYSVQAPETLVLWEAQYGDFANSAQVMIDNFVVSGRVKWGQRPGLVLLLPHAYEGQGPEHSSARLERFLELAAGSNLRIANCTTAAQYFHLLRRQAALLAADPRPLVVMTPKSLLRHPLSRSPVRDLAHGQFMPVIDDGAARSRAEVIRRLILCSGKIYVDLATSDLFRQTQAVALVRVEQFYPFPLEEIRSILDEYRKLEEVVWVQEEPENMGGWDFVRPALLSVLRSDLPLRYAGRPRRASPSEGVPAWHQAAQARIVKEALSGVEQVEKIGARD